MIGYFFRQTAPVVVLATMAVSFYLYVTGESEIAVIGSFTLHVTDLLFCVTVVYCVAGALSRWYYSVFEMALLILSAFLVISFGLGVATVGAAKAGVGFRMVAVFVALVTFIYFWGRALNIEWLFKKIIMLGWAIVALSALRLVLGLDAFVLAEPVPGYAWRTLGGNSALMLGEASLISLNWAVSAPGRVERWVKWVTFVVFLATLLVSNQRTAIFATLAGVLVIIVFLHRHYRTIAIVVGIAVLISAGIFFWAAWTDVGGSMTEYLPRAISMISSGEGTFAARERYWELYLDAYLRAPLINRLFGLPFGAPELMIVEANEFLPTAHNGYMQLMLNAGAVGVMIFMLLLASAFIRGILLLLAGSGAAFNLRLATAIIVSHAIFSIAYLLPNEQGLLFAVALQVIARSSRVSKKVLVAHDFASARGCYKERGEGIGESR